MIGQLTEIEAELMRRAAKLRDDKYTSTPGTGRKELSITMPRK